MTLLARGPSMRDLFWIDGSGAIQTAYSHIASGTTHAPWSAYPVSGANVAHNSSPLAAVSRYPDHLDLFWVGPDGSVRSAWWDSHLAEGWTGHQFAVVGANSADPRSGVTAVARRTDQVDVFWIAPDGSLWTSWWSGASSTWLGHTYRILGPGSVRVGSPVVAATPHADRIDLVFCTPTGELRHTLWDSTRELAWPSPTAISTAASPVAGVGYDLAARRPGHLDVFWCASDGGVWTSWSDDADASGWARHAYQVAPPGNCAPGSRLSICARNGNHLDVTWTGTTGALMTTWWDATAGAHLSANVYRIPGTSDMSLVQMTAPHEDALATLARTAAGDLTLVGWVASDSQVVAGTQNGKIYHGTITANDPHPTLNEATISRLPAGMASSGRSRTSVALSRYTGAAYAVMARTDLPPPPPVPPDFLAVLISSDNGATWTASDPTTVVDGNQSVVLSTAAGSQGAGYNNCVAAAPLDPGSALIGWQNGVIATSDGGRSFDKWMRPEKPFAAHLHADVHHVRFDSRDRNGRRVFIASDGGLAVSPDFGATAVSRYNRKLLNLQCYTTDAAGRDSTGTLGGGGDVTGLLTCGLQDNGNVWSFNGGPWQRFTGGDGGISLLTKQRQVLSSEELDSVPVQRSEWDEANERVTVPVDIPITVHPPGDASANLGGSGFAGVVNDPVSQDAFGAKILAIGFRNNQLFGFWNPTGVVTWRWEFIVALPLAPGESITAAASANGNVIHAATSLSNFFQVTRAGVATPLPNDAIEANYGVNYLCVMDDNNALALSNDWRGNTNGNKILRLSAGRWRALPRTLRTGGTIPNERCFALETDWTANPQTIFVCTDSKIYVSSDGGQTWDDQSNGLPARAHLADLQLVVNADGPKDLLLSTWGRSFWKSAI